MGKKALLTDNAPKPVGPYSQAVQAGDLVFVSGQVPFDPTTGQLIQGDIGTLTRRTLDNVLAILKQGGMGAEHIVKTTVFLRDMSDFAAMNEAYASYFADVVPARSCVEVARLPKDVPVEIEAIAMRNA